MYFNNSTKVFSANFDVTFKLILYRVIVTLILLALGSAILLPSLLPIIADFSELGVFTMIQEFIEKAISFTFDRSELVLLSQNINDMSSVIILNHAAHMTGTYVGIGVLGFLAYLFAVVGDYPVGEMINGACELKSKVSFSVIMLTKLGKIIRYSLVKILFFLPIDAALILATYFVLVGTSGVLSFFAVFIAMVIIIFGYSLRLTYLSNYLPTMINEDLGAFKSFFKGLSYTNSRFGKIYSTSIIFVIIAISVNLMIGVFTFGVGLCVSLPATVVLFKSSYFVTYYHIKGMRYYTENDDVVNPKPEKERENSFQYDLRQD